MAYKLKPWYATKYQRLDLFLVNMSPTEGRKEPHIRNGVSIGSNHLLLTSIATLLWTVQFIFNFCSNRGSTILSVNSPATHLPLSTWHSRQIEGSDSDSNSEHIDFWLSLIDKPSCKQSNPSSTPLQQQRSCYLLTFVLYNYFLC